jgi:2-methylisocitrate lyase-like PEP mutase family enzyme
MGSTHRALAERFRNANTTGRLLLPNAWDAASARVFEEAGFAAVGTTSAGIAYAHGVRDAERLDRDTMVRAVARIVAAVSCPVNADIEAGYGPGAADVGTTVDAVLDAGAAGINLEDNTHGHGAAPLFAIDEQCARIAAARDAAARRGIPLVINARTDTFLLSLGEDIDERVSITIARGTRYLEAGADLVFVPLVVSPAVVKPLADGLRGRLSLMALPGAPPAADLFAAGAARVSIGQLAMLGTLGALRQIAEELRERGTWSAIERTFYGFGQAEALFPANGGHED